MGIESCPEYSTTCWAVTVLSLCLFCIGWWWCKEREICLTCMSWCTTWSIHGSMGGDACAAGAVNSASSCKQVAGWSDENKLSVNFHAFCCCLRACSRGLSVWVSGLCLCRFSYILQDPEGHLETQRQRQTEVQWRLQCVLPVCPGELSITPMLVECVRGIPVSLEASQYWTKEWAMLSCWVLVPSLPLSPPSWSAPKTLDWNHFLNFYLKLACLQKKKKNNKIIKFCLESD